VYPCELKTGSPYAFINGVGADFDFWGIMRCYLKKKPKTLVIKRFTEKEKALRFQSNGIKIVVLIWSG
jgi:hypothetical protein